MRKILPVLLLAAACQSGPTKPADPPSGTPPDMAEAPIGTMTVSVDVGTALPDNYMLGEKNTSVISYLVCVENAPGGSGMLQEMIPAVLYQEASALQAHTNIRLTPRSDGTKQLGTAQDRYTTTVPGTSATLSGFAFARLTNVGFTVKNGECLVVDQRTDFAKYEELGALTTGQKTTPILLESFTNQSGQDPTVIAVSANGTPLKVIVKNNGSGATKGAMGSENILYRTKLTTAWAPDSPPNNSTASPAANTRIAKLTITNAKNAGNYSATVNLISPELMSMVMAVNARTIQIFSDTGVLLATYTFTAGTTITGKAEVEENLFSDVTIAAGSARSFVVSLDASDFGGHSLLTRLPIGSVTWTDGVQPPGAIKAMGYDFPLAWHRQNF